jgi:hypothetical protein
MSVDSEVSHDERQAISREFAYRDMLIGPYVVKFCKPGTVSICNGRDGAEFREFSVDGFKRALEEGESAGDVLGAVDRFYWEGC